MNIRTDIASELRDSLSLDEQNGVKTETRKIGEIEITKIIIATEEAEKKTAKPKGSYFTVSLPEFSHESELLDERFEVIKGIIKTLLPRNSETFLVAGLGNEKITPDALGPLCANKIFSTRHFESITGLKYNLPHLNPVSAISTGVLGQTGIETSEYISGIASFVRPDAVVIVDALATSKKENLGKTVQISDTGITPGSGVGNYRKSIDEKTLGIPVISIGVPTVIEFEGDTNMFVTPKEIDNIVNRAAGLLSMCINCALQPDLTPDMILALS